MEELANLNIIEEEEEPLQAQGNIEVIKEDYSLYLVGCSSLSIDEKHIGGFMASVGRSLHYIY
ncbi:hypothetical protein Gotri_025930 [Gossypium trilobum]|uniref:Uncharacterized protein n=1 Tax=Gossypium trilobum TaxID=34281 RepID=A0A7J9FNA1_9ROSI|nr:hypothetical protein [Gossypium trilobum]